MAVMNNETVSSIPLVALQYQIATKVGALTSAVLSFALIVLPILINSPDIGGWWPLVLFFSTATATVSGIAGGIAGRFASKTANSAIGALIGTLVFFAVGIGYYLFFVSSREPPLNQIRPFLFAIVVGGVSGASSSVAARSNSHGTASVIRRLLDALTFIVLSAILATWCIHESSERESVREIYDAGGSVAWDSSKGLPGYWDISFSDKQLDDRGLQDLLPTLNRYVPLDLDLGNAEVSYRGLSMLRDLTHLVRLRFANAVLSDAEVTQLQQQLPDTEILIWKP